LRIALVALHFAEYSGRLALALAERHEVLLVLRSDNAHNELSPDLLRQLERKVHLRMFTLPRRRDPRYLLTSSAINRIVADFRPDVLHMQEMRPTILGWTHLYWRRRIPVIVTVHDPVPHSGSDLGKHSLTWKTITWFRERATRIIVHGPRMREELDALSPGIANMVDIIPHGVLGCPGGPEDINGYEPGTFLFFGRMESYKGLRYLLDAGDILHSRGHDFRLVVAGTGDDLIRYRDRIASSRWVELIDRYIGAAEVPALFRRAMSVVLPYTDATQSGVSAMAFAYSRPVIATDVGDLPEVVIDGRTGLTVPPRDGESLACAMERMLLEHRLRDALAVNATRFAQENLSWPVIARSTSETYLRAVKGRERQALSLS